MQVQLATLLAMFVNAHRDPKSSREAKPDQFLPGRRAMGNTRNRMTPEQTAAFFEATFSNKIAKAPHA